MGSRRLDLHRDERCLGAALRQHPTPKTPATGGKISTIFGGWVPGITQEFGRTDWSVSHSSMYTYGSAYGLADCSHTGLAYGANRGTKMFSPVAGKGVTAGWSTGCPPAS